MKDTKTIYEQLGGTYREGNSNLVPDVELPEQKPIGKYGRMHLDYLKQHRRGRYSALLGEGRINRKQGMYPSGSSLAFINFL